MEELTIKQKAKRYDEICKEVKNFFDGKQKMYNDIEQALNYLFPELKKSEDERIKEDLIQWIDEFPDTIWRGHHKKDVIDWLKKQGEQEQDVNIQINPSEYINDMGGNGCYLKNTTQISTWGEEDENAIGMAIIALDDMYDPDEPNNTYAGYSMPFNKAAKRLKSLRPQNRWKPSDEQIEALKTMTRFCEIATSFDAYKQRVVESLYSDLKKLKGE